ncbi:MAG: hypothetical protein CMN28_07410 [Salinisphaeraceae bacterium]|nr:hypothetical protein [Salinisphaeraceae bacterium]
MKSLYVSAVVLVAVYTGGATLAKNAQATGMDAFDLNNDNRVSLEESAGAIRHFDRYDADGNGSLNAAEFEAVVEQVRPKPAQARPASSSDAEPAKTESADIEPSI